MIARAQIHEADRESLQLDISVTLTVLEAKFLLDPSKVHSVPVMNFNRIVRDSLTRLVDRVETSTPVGP